MTTYLDISVVSVQAWLARTPRLQARRGASTLIRQATDPSRISALLAPHANAVRINTDAGRVDGVVSMELFDLGAADTVSALVLAELRRLLPAASLSCIRREGDGYSAARAATEVSTQDWLPAVSEWPAAKPCDWCRSWAAAEHVSAGEERIDLCVDCLARRPAGGWPTSADAARAPGTERDLLDRVGSGQVPDDFAQLAELGQSGDNTHLATVYADGNAVGRFAEYIHRVGRDEVFPLAAAIDTATWSALLAGLNAITRDADEGVLPIIAHYVGGDDILVTVPAHRMWRFAASALPRFGESIAETAHGVRSAVLPSLSAGVVVHHRSAPLSQVVDTAGRLLREAKDQHRGERSALSWQSITHEGPDPTTRPSVPASLLIRQWDDLAQLAALPGSAQARLAELCQARLRGAAHDQLTTHVTRIGLDDVVDPFLTPGSIPLVDALAMTRWWA